MATLRREGTAEEEPLLGERGDASLPDGKPLYHNFVLGMRRNGCENMMAVETDMRHRHWCCCSSRSMDRESYSEDKQSTQADKHPQIAAIVWGAVFSNDLILFSAHPVRPRLPCSMS